MAENRHNVAVELMLNDIAVSIYTHCRTLLLLVEVNQGWN